MELPARIGKYELLEFLGGGMSHVFRARDTLIDRPVVVKILTDASNNDRDARMRFLQEARLAGNIQHENIVSVFDYGEHEGCPYIVMEYLKGEDLRDAIRGNRLGGMADRLKVAQDIAAALAYVHAQGVVHRDIKPENIHIDPNGRVKLMDFGIAKTADLSLTKTGMAMGTPYYMAPEQVQGQPTTPLMDIYSYGLLFYELLTGIRGVSGDSMESVFYQILNVTLDVGSMESAGAPPAVRELVIRCTAKRPENRPQSFRVIVDELQAIRMGGGTVAPHTQPIVRPGTAPVPAVPMPVPAVPTPVHAATPVQAVPTPRGGAILWIAAAVVVLLAGGLGAWWFLRPTPVAQIPGMFYVPAGTFLAGAEKKSTPLPAFFMDEAEVTNGEFAEFCKASGCTPPVDAPELPVVKITVAEARSYAASKGKRLPSALEWERAARGPNGALFPWGNEVDPSRANVEDNPSSAHRLMPARSFAPYPAFQMIGNAWEMVEGKVTPSDEAVNLFAKLLTPSPTAQEPWISIRGGSLLERLTPALSYESGSIPERFSANSIGFRCARTP